MNITAFGILALRAAGQGDVAKSAGLAAGRSELERRLGVRAGPRLGRRLDRRGAAGARGGRAAARRRFPTELATSPRPRRAMAAGRSSGGVVNSQSTAWAVQGLVAARGSGSAISKGVSYLAKRQAGDGHYAYSAASDQTPVWVTAQALTAVTRRPFPLAAVARAPKSGAGSPEGSDGPGGTGAGPGGEAGARGGGEGSERGREGNKGGKDEGGGGSARTRQESAPDGTFRCAWRDRRAWNGRSRAGGRGGGRRASRTRRRSASAAASWPS